MQRSSRGIWLWRAAAVGFAVVYLASSGMQAWLPPLVPFLAVAAVEAQFFVAGMRSAPGRRLPADRGPQPRDLEELGYEEPEAPARPRRRIRPRLLPALAVVTLFGVLVLLDARGTHWQRLSSAQRSATIAVLEREAGRIAGHPATIICDTSGRHVGYVQDADGLAEVGGKRAWLTPSICYRLYQVKHSGRASGASSGEAIAVLAHEAWHLHGEADEGRANCFAYQSGVRVGQALGLAPATARQLMHQQLADNLADFEASPQYVVPSGCHRSGALDLHLDGSHFP